jgi:hypothetical protein
LSCDYYGDSGVRKKGWEGYCLDYDRYPGSSDACLLWYPIDKVKGAGIEEGAGYRGKFPVYYCVDYFQDGYTEYVFDLKEKPIVHNHWIGYGEGRYDLRSYSFWDEPGVSDLFNKDSIIWARLEGGQLSGPHNCGPGADNFGTREDKDLGITNYPASQCSQPPGGDCGPNFYLEIVDGYARYIYYTFFQSECLQQGATHNSLRIRVKRFACKDLVQAVSSIGQNKAWSGRVYEGSDYEYSCGINTNNVCEFNTDAKPFGSITYPSPANNPYEWDSNPNIGGNQPLHLLDKVSNSEKIKLVNPIQSVNMGQLHSPDELKKIFAQSYGAWEWNGSNYALSDDSDLYWGPPTDPCSNQNNRGEAYCAILPTVSNINITGYSGSAIINGSGFVNLRFNSNADDDQLPLVMYSVNWGDNERTTVSGVEMRDRPGTESPHSLYHLYSYWDMKSKDNRGSDTIYCGGAGQVVAGGPATPPNKPYCAVKPGVVIKDNWGWCSNGTEREECEELEYFDNWIIVTEN